MSSSTLQTDLLLQTVGERIQSMKNKPLGIITEITRNADNTQIAYLIIKSEQLFGPGTRYFAIPASSAFIEITGSGDVILLTNIDDLQFAKGVDADQCPEPKFQFSPPVFELYQYQEPEASNTLSNAKND